jgi:hypothetical protein
MTLHDAPHRQQHHSSQSATSAWVLRILLFALIGVVGYYLIAEHRAHLFQALPLIVLLACPLMHLFHGGHGGHRPRQGGPSDPGVRDEQGSPQ